MMKELKKAIEAVEVLDLEDGDEICSSLIQKAILNHVTFLDWKQAEILSRLPMIGSWVTIYHKNQGEGYVDFERWHVVDSVLLHKFIMEHDATCRGFGKCWSPTTKRLTVIETVRDDFHHDAETRRKIALAGVEFVESWLAKN